MRSVQVSGGASTAHAWHGAHACRSVLSTPDGAVERGTQIGCRSSCQSSRTAGMNCRSLQQLSFDVQLASPSRAVSAYSHGAAVWNGASSCRGWHRAAPVFSSIKRAGFLSCTSTPKVSPGVDACLSPRQSSARPYANSHALPKWRIQCCGRRAGIHNGPAQPNRLVASRTVLCVGF